MNQRNKGIIVSATIGIGTLFGLVANGADLLPARARLVAVSSAPAPQQNAFSVATAQDLVVTLTDLKTPAALSSASVVVTQADAIVGSATFTSPASSATVQLPAAKGNYLLQIVGTPDPNFSAGSFSACVAPKADPANCIQTASLSGIIVTQSAASDPTLSTLSLTLTVTTAGA